MTETAGPYSAYVAGPEQRSSITFETGAKGEIKPKVHVYLGDCNPADLDELLAQTIRVYTEALAFAKEQGGGA